MLAEQIAENQYYQNTRKWVFLWLPLIS
jgi:hypothetical protein